MPLSLTSCRLPALLLSVGAANGFAQDVPWPAEHDLESRIAAVSGRDLRILPVAPGQPVHHHVNRIRVTPQSLADGWGEIHQCHRNLDPVPASEIVFGAERTRDLTVRSQSRIGSVWIENASVQLRDVEPGAALCIGLQSRALDSIGEESFQLRSGPYMRRFLDGYYPMRVSLELTWPSSALHLVGSTPQSQAGVQMESTPGRVSLDLWFEGELNTIFHFCPGASPGCRGDDG